MTPQERSQLGAVQSALDSSLEEPDAIHCSHRGRPVHHQSLTPHRRTAVSYRVPISCLAIPPWPAYCAPAGCRIVAASVYRVYAELVAGEASIPRGCSL